MVEVEPSPAGKNSRSVEVKVATTLDGVSVRKDERAMRDIPALLL